MPNRFAPLSTAAVPRVDPRRARPSAPADDPGRAGPDTVGSDLVGSHWHGVDSQATDVALSAHVDSLREHRRRTAPVQVAVPEWLFGAGADARAEPWRMRFDGRVAPYTWLSLVHALAVLGSLGLLYPWARARARRYKLSHLRLAERALQPGALRADDFLQALCVAASVLALGAMAADSLAAGLAGAAGAVALWPWLMQRRVHRLVADSTWQGIRLRHAARGFDAYRTYALSALLGAVGLVLAVGLVGELAHGGLAAAGAWRWMPLAGAWWTTSALLAPLCWWLHRRALIHPTSVGPQRLQWTARWQDVYAIHLAGMAWMGALYAMEVLGLWWSATRLGWPASRALWAGLLRHGPLAPAGAGIVAAWVVAPWLVGVPYVQARLHNLTWSRTGGTYVRVRSRLAVWPYVAVHAASTLLGLFTLGLAWPWAAMLKTRRRVQSIQVIASSGLGSRRDIHGTA